MGHRVHVAPDGARVGTDAFTPHAATSKEIREKARSVVVTCLSTPIRDNTCFGQAEATRTRVFSRLARFALTSGTRRAAKLRESAYAPRQRG